MLIFLVIEIYIIMMLYGFFILAASGGNAINNSVLELEVQTGYCSSKLKAEWRAVRYA